MLTYAFTTIEHLSPEQHGKLVESVAREADRGILGDAAGLARP